MNTKVSVIVPFYNVRDYLADCVESVLAQTLQGTELILVDDGSSDGSGDMADAYCSRYPEIVRVLHQENRGPASARNAGLEIARGAYVHFLDSDDRLKPHALETLYSEAAGKDLDILFFCAEVFSDNPDLQEDVKVHRDEFIRADQAGIVMSGKESLRMLYENRREEYPAPVWIRLYRRAYLTDCGIRYPIGRIHEDEDFGFFTYYYARRIELIRDVLLERRLRTGSIMYTKKVMDSVLGYQNAFLKIIDLYNRTEDKEDRALLIRHSERLIFYTLLFFLKADEASRGACRPVIDTYMEKALPFRENYSAPVRTAMAWYEGQAPEDRVSLPEIPYLCYSAAGGMAGTR